MGGKGSGNRSSAPRAPGAGRPPQIAERAYALQQATANAKARANLRESELAISIAATRAALRDLETEMRARQGQAGPTES